MQRSKPNECEFVGCQSDPEFRLLTVWVCSDCYESAKQHGSEDVGAYVQHNLPSGDSDTEFGTKPDDVLQREIQELEFRLQTEIHSPDEEQKLRHKLEKKKMQLGD